MTCLLLFLRCGETHKPLENDLHGFPGHWPLALAILENVLMQRLEPDIITYSAAISACEERNELGPARCGFEDVEHPNMAWSIIFFPIEK